MRLALPLLALLLAACPAPPLPSSDAPIRCERDADCHAPACGPCNSGAPLRQNSPDCAINPCPNVVVVCSPQKICVVK